MADEKKKSVGVFEVVYIALLVVLLALAVFFMGRPRIGVLDMTAVAKGVGVDETIIEDTREWQEMATGKVKKLQEQFDERGSSLRASLESAETDAEKEKAQEEMQEVTQEFYRQTAVVRGRLRKHRRDVVRTFRLRLEPFITQVARKKRLWLVLERSGRILYSRAQIDITDDVIEKARPSFREDPSLVGAQDEEGTEAK